MNIQKPAGAQFGDHFLDKKVEAKNKLRRVYAIMDGKERADGKSQNIKDNAELRQLLMEVEECLSEMHNMHRQEVRKRKSRWSVQEISDRERDVEDLRREVEHVKALQKHSYLSGSGGIEQGSLTDTMLASASASAGSGRGESMSDSHRSQLQAIRDRDDAEVKMELSAIEEGSLSLKQIAVSQNQEVRDQNRMMDGMDSRVEGLHSRVELQHRTLRTAMKKPRLAERICVNSMCFLLTIGLVFILYRLTQTK